MWDPRIQEIKPTYHVCHSLQTSHVLPVGTVWVLCGCCVGAEWALSGYCCVCGRRHSAHFLWSCRASRFTSSGAGHGMSSHGRRGRAALWASIAPGHLYRRSENFWLCFFTETSKMLGLGGAVFFWDERANIELGGRGGTRTQNK